MSGKKKGPEPDQNYKLEILKKQHKINPEVIRSKVIR